MEHLAVNSPVKQASPKAIRIATFNIAMGFESAGEMAAALANPEHLRLRQLAAILQTVRPDIVLLNEFDFDGDVDAAGLLNQKFLNVAHEGRLPIEYPYHFHAPSNTGIPSGLDLTGDGKNDGPGDAWGFGHFPGQYGMLLLSRFPVDEQRARTFRNFRWSALPRAKRPLNPDGSDFYTNDSWQQLRLSSKSHWDVPIAVAGSTLHVLAFHPTPPVFDGPEKRNALRNFDEIRFWTEYLDSKSNGVFVDDQGRSGGFPAGEAFVLLGDINADPNDGDSLPGAAQQLLNHPRINASFTPVSTGAAAASEAQGGINNKHEGNPAADTADFNDRYTGNLRLDFVLPSRELEIQDGGVFWPSAGEPGFEWIQVSDHHLVWLDIPLNEAQP
jgi:3-phytase/alkaline phosphatase D